MKGKQTRTNSGLWFSGMDIKLSDVCKKITDGSHNPPKGIEHSDYLMLSSKNVFDDFISFEEPRYLSEEDYINRILIIQISIYQKIKTEQTMII